MTYTDVPLIAGVAFPRPSSLQEPDELVRNTVELAGGGTRAYAAGTRRVFELGWSKLTEDQVVQLRGATAAPFVAYRHVNGLTYIVETGPVSATAIAGTDPTRFQVSITLRAQGVS